MRYVPKEEEAAGGRVSIGQIEHDAEDPGEQGVQPSNGAEDEVLEGAGSIVAPQRFSAHGKTYEYVWSPVAIVWFFDCERGCNSLYRDGSYRNKIDLGTRVCVKDFAPCGS